MTRLIAGAMSGTSADGVDVAITEISGSGLEMRARLVHHHQRAYAPELRGKIFAVRNAGAAALADLAELGREISLVYAAAVKETLAAARLQCNALAAIAAHGQTLYHAPLLTIQWLDPALLAAETNSVVVSDFRRADCAAGGQGAPLVPFADYLLFRDAQKDRVLLNIGGIANLTYIPAGASLDDLIAFDTGPGNCISDHLCRTHDASGPGFDAGGVLAEKGKPHFATAFSMARSKYAFAKPPKSTDGPAMIAEFQRISTELGSAALPLADLLATACLATAYSVEMSLSLFVPLWREKELEMIVSGGGTENRFLMRELEKAIVGTNPRVRLLAIEALGVPSAAKEAVAFALLGAATLDGFPANVPSATGARRRVVLGSVTPKP
ncbi:MAG TPA: anhydro-N-acetylmuramic acid kinase [Tepidisphaeraceae bacterium]